jgi:CheY-like chemotaxis protein
MSSAEAFLSYTRIDDEYFGGNISGLRKLLELGVQVVTGDREFKIFQDIDGIELGQNWAAKIDSALGSARLLIPILTPCFLGSNACRDELSKFIAHEKSMSRDDLIIPIYFVTVPSLERDEPEVKDSLAVELRKRQRYDWRDQSDSPLTEVGVRKSVRDLCQKISVALQRTDGSVAQMMEKEVINNPSKITLDTNLESWSNEIENESKAKAEFPRRSILWVDDRPANNILERQSLRSYGFEFDLAQSTQEALDALRSRRFDLIISDMGRPPDARAGYTLLDAVRGKGDNTPYIIYAGSRSPEHTAEAIRRGAQGTTNRPSELVSMVMDAIGKP